MALKKLEVPTTSITEVKKSPMDVFQQARDNGTGVYVFNREKIAGVMLTQEQYEDLLQELADKRQQLEASSKEVEVPAEVVTIEKMMEESMQPIVKEAVEVATDQTIEGLEELYKGLHRSIASGSLMPAKILDERMVALGFITNKSGFGGVSTMMKELIETGKIIYHLRRKPEGKSIIAEIIGEPDNQSQLFDKVIIKRTHLTEE